jgi:cytochrome c peroxidase
LPGYFPKPALPLDNPLTDEGVELGRRLFNDPQLSVNNRQSCAHCHQPDIAFSDGQQFSSGAEGRVGTRNAMGLFNLAWKTSFFWDGRAASLREQVLMPIQNPIEMNQPLSLLPAKLAALPDRAAPKTGVMRAGFRDPDSIRVPCAAARMALEPDASRGYPRLFARAFGTSEINADRIARALEQFLLVQTSDDSRFDRVLRNEAEFSDEEKRGFELFHAEFDPRRGQRGADCFHCHGGPLFQSQAFANNGLAASVTDSGRAAVTGKTGDAGKFAVPSLRNVAITAPYMHDGRFTRLEQVIEHYSTGIHRSDTLDPNLAKHPDGGIPLSTADKRALVSFLRTLTDERLAPNRVNVALLPQK